MSQSNTQSSIEMFEEMKRRHASGSLMDIVKPLLTRPDIFHFPAAGLHEHNTHVDDVGSHHRASTSALALALGERSAGDHDGDQKEEQQQQSQLKGGTLRLRRQVGTYPVHADMFLTLSQFVAS
jgi:hypothetical protein